MTLPEAELDRATVIEIALDYLLDLDERFDILTAAQRAALDVLLIKDAFSTFGQASTFGNPIAVAKRGERLRNVMDRMTEAFPLETAEVA